MEFYNSCLALAVVVLSSTVTVPVPVVQLSDLVDRADVIVVGTVIGVNVDGAMTFKINDNAITGERRVASVSVDEVLKGNQQLSLMNIVYGVPDEPIGFRMPRVGTQQLFFLKRVGNTFEFASPYYPDLPAVSGDPTTESDPADKVIQVLGRVIRSDSVSALEKAEVMEMIRGNRSAAAIATLNTMLASRDRELSLKAAATLVSAHDYRGLALIESIIIGSRIGVSDETYADVLDAIRTVSDVSALPLLERAIAGGDADVREAAVRALRNIGSPQAIDALIRRLDDDEQRVRYHAVIGLAESTGKSEWGPSFDAFLADEQRYIRAWKDWARTR